MSLPKRSNKIRANRSLTRLLLSVVPFLLLIGLYLWLSYQRHVTNPTDKLLPMPGQLLDALQRSWMAEEGGTGSTVPFVVDTLASLGRLMTALAISSLVALGMSILLAASETLYWLLYPLLVVIAKIPPIAVLPILLLWMGINEASKVVLVILGITPYFTLHVLDSLKRNRHQVAEKMYTLLMPAWQRILFVDLPMVWPPFLQQFQASLGPAWLFLLVAETVGAENGLGYRIFVVRRFLAMDTILVYVTWIAILSVGFYYLVDLWKHRSRWYFGE